MWLAGVVGWFDLVAASLRPDFSLAGIDERGFPGPCSKLMLHVPCTRTG